MSQTLATHPRLWLGEGLRWYLKEARHPLKGYLVGHYWSWFSKPVLWVKYDDSMAIGVRLGDYLQQQIFYQGYYELALIEWLKSFLVPDDVFWDVGANIGAITVVAAKRCAKVAAFEPDPRSIRSLEKNVRVNRLTNVEIVTSALGDASGALTLYQAADRNSGMTSLIPGRSEVVGETQVNVVRADELLKRRPDLTPTVMKLDVEGAEHLVLDGATELLQSGRVRAIVFEDRGDADAGPANREVVERLRQANYHIAPFAASDPQVSDNMYNFLATPLAQCLAAAAAPSRQLPRMR